MAKKQFFLVMDCETTIENHIADIACVVYDRQGKIHAQMAVLLREFFTTEELFYNVNAVGIWSKQYAKEKRSMYERYLVEGHRMLASVNAVNCWLAKAVGQFPGITWTAYNKAFDADKAKKSGVNMEQFTSSFCLWHAAVGNICNSKAYKTFALENHLFTNVTEKTKACSISTTAESVTSFLNGSVLVENHDALGDVIDFEGPILNHIINKRGWKEKITPYNYRDFQVKNHFAVK